MYPRVGPAVAMLATLMVACGGASSDGLFAPPGTAPSGAGGLPPWETGGAFGAGGSGSAGSGGASGGSQGGATNPSGCDFGGTWASYIQAPVTWPATPSVLFAGSGNLQQWNISHQTMNGNDVTAVTVPCGIFLPDLQSDFLGGYAKFGIRFPDNIFDAGNVPDTTFVLHGRVTATGFAFQTDPFAIVLGTVLQDPVNDPWPAVASLSLVDHDLDGKPGITVVPAPGNGYSFPPSDLTGGRADLIYIAERTVSSLAGTVVSCDEVHADVTIQTVDGKPGIDSTVVGCRKTDGTECSASDAAFIDANRPQYTPSSVGTMISVRMPDGSTCKDVRARFPRQ